MISIGQWISIWYPFFSAALSVFLNDLPIFELNIATNSVQSLGFSYPSVGYYMGFRQTLQRSSNLMLVAEKLGNYIGDPYIFVRMNDWGHVDIFNEKMFAKVLLTPDLGLVKLDEFYSKEFKFKQSIETQANELFAGKDCELVSLHMRLGDYFNMPECHPVCSIEYYKEALYGLPVDVQIILFRVDVDK